MHARLGRTGPYKTEPPRTGVRRRLRGNTKAGWPLCPQRMRWGCLNSSVGWPVYRARTRGAARKPSGWGALSQGEGRRLSRAGGSQAFGDHETQKCESSS